jgi:hypothetical protein
MYDAIEVEEIQTLENLDYVVSSGKGKNAYSS